MRECWFVISSHQRNDDTSSKWFPFQRRKNEQRKRIIKNIQYKRHCTQRQTRILIMETKKKTEKEKKKTQSNLANRDGRGHYRMISIVIKLQHSASRYDFLLYPPNPESDGKKEEYFRQQHHCQRKTYTTSITPILNLPDTSIDSRSGTWGRSPINFKKPSSSIRFPTISHGWIKWRRKRSHIRLNVSLVAPMPKCMIRIINGVTGIQIPYLKHKVHVKDKMLMDQQWCDQQAYCPIRTKSDLQVYS